MVEPMPIGRKRWTLVIEGLFTDLFKWHSSDLDGRSFETLPRPHTTGWVFLAKQYLAFRCTLGMRIMFAIPS